MVRRTILRACWLLHLLVLLPGGGGDDQAPGDARTSRPPGEPAQTTAGPRARNASTGGMPARWPRPLAPRLGDR